MSRTRLNRPNTNSNQKQKPKKSNSMKMELFNYYLKAADTWKQAGELASLAGDIEKSVKFYASATGNMQSAANLFEDSVQELERNYDLVLEGELEREGGELE